MFSHEDWLMRQIEMIASAMIKLFLGKEKEKEAFVYEKVGSSGETDAFEKELLALADAGKICDAENLLYEKIEESSEIPLITALRFYSNLNKLSDDELEKYDFSRQEILSGIKMVSQKFGVENVALNILAEENEESSGI